MFVVLEFDQGGIEYKHKHYHFPVTYIESGIFEFSKGEGTKTVKSGVS